MTLAAAKLAAERLLLPEDVLRYIAEAALRGVGK